MEKTDKTNNPDKSVGVVPGQVKMRDSRCFNGTQCATKNMAVAPDGRCIAFKTDKRLVSLVDVDGPNGSMDLHVDGLELVHSNDQIFDLCFLSDDRLVLLLQETETNRVLICRAQIDRQERRLKIDSNIVDTHMVAKNGITNCLIQDERGPVLVSFPLRFIKGSPNNVELLHLHDYFRNDGGRKLTLGVKAHTEGLWSDPFVSRNTLYLLNRFDCNLLCITLSGSKIGTSRLLKTYPDAKQRYPNKLFVNKCVQVLEDMVLVYFHQRVDNPKCKPQLWKLELSSLQWNKLHLSLSHHCPVSRVSLQKARDEDIAFLHGDCGFADCRDRVHLYELIVDQESLTKEQSPIALGIGASLSQLNHVMDRVGDTVKRSLSASDLFAQPSTSSPSSSSPSRKSPPPPKSPIPTPSSSHVPPSMRYANRKGQSNGNAQTNLNGNTRPQSLCSSASGGNVSTISLPTCLTGKQYVHWSDQMADEGGGALVAQLSAAKDMGYTDSEIYKALEMNGKDGYRAFPSTSAMVDMLIRVKSMQNGKGAHSSGAIQLDNHNEGVNELRSPTSPMRSPPPPPLCNGHCSCSTPDGGTAPRNPPLQLQRLLDAFEKDRRGYEEENQRAIARITDRCHQAVSGQNQLQIELRQKDTEIAQMRIKLHDHRNLELQFATIKRQLEQEQQNDAAKCIELRHLQEQHESARKEMELARNRYEKELSDVREELRQCQMEIQPRLKRECDSLRKRLAQMANELTRFENAKDELARLNEAVERISMERDGFRAQLSKLPVCVVCLDKQPQLLFLPCSHFVCCESCGKNLDTCPTCRAKLCGKCRAFQ